MTTITLPWPDPRLFPNYKRSHHWRKYRQQERDARLVGWGLTAEAMEAAHRAAISAAEGKIAVAVTFYPPDRRKRDDDGCIGAIKNFRDGIADALGVDDARFSTTYAFGDAEKPGRVEVIL